MYDMGDGSHGKDGEGTDRLRISWESWTKCPYRRVQRSSRVSWGMYMFIGSQYRLEVGSFYDLRMRCDYSRQSFKTITDSQTRGLPITLSSETFGNSVSRSLVRNRIHSPFLCSHPYISRPIESNSTVRNRSHKTKNLFG